MTRLVPLTLSLLGCTAEVPADTACLTTALETELGVQESPCEPARPTADGKADGAIDTPGLRYLRSRSERELAELFAAGHADAIPIGRNDGTPLLLGLDWLAPALSQIYVGSIWEPQLAPDGTPLVGANGDPVILLRDAWLRDGDGHRKTLFAADVTRGDLASVVVAPGIAPPGAPSRPHPLLPIYRDRLALDGKPSLFVSYHRDPTPVINRILDEIRAVDPVKCPGLYLGRAHYRRPGGEWVYLYWFALDFGPRQASQACELP